MNRYKIQNLRNGGQFNVEAESLERHPNYGLSEGTKLKSECDEWELANGESSGENEEGVELWSYPDSMNLISTVNIDQELAEKEIALTEKLDALQALKDCDPDDATTVAALRTIVKNIRKVLIG